MLESAFTCRRFVVSLALAATVPMGLRWRPDSRALAATTTPTVVLTRATSILLTGRVDSNSPAIWDLADGRNLLHVFTSFDGFPSLALGTDVQRLGSARPVTVSGFDGGGFWLEAVVMDGDGTLYGYFHNELPATFCPGSDKFIPRVVAGRSTDQGLTWQNLGVVLESPPGATACATTNKYFVGGVGDLTVLLDPNAADLYIFYSQYLRSASEQGVAVARLAWADRDAPAGKVSVWRDGVWQPARRYRVRRPDGETITRYLYPAATPLYPTTDSLHDGDASANAFWGPSVHWNTYLQQYVMLLNRMKNSQFDQEGIYIAYAPTLADPGQWTVPVKILNGGSWYPQVIGIEPASGTDKVAGERARLFITGRSDYVMQFVK